MTQTEVHVLLDHGRWGVRVNGEALGAGPQHRAVKLALRMARALAIAQDARTSVIVHEANGAVRSVLSFGGGSPLRIRRRPRRQATVEGRVPLALAARFQRDLAALVR